jgi:hypothetical protein
MSRPRFALRLIACADSLGIQEAIVGDVLEELGRGRSRLWLWQQLWGIYRLALVQHVRIRTRLTPHAVALAMTIALAVGAKGGFASTRSVVAGWLSFYYLTGLLSLVAHMLSQSIGTRGTGLSETGET